MFKRLAPWALAFMLPVLLAACDTAEERAQKHFEKGMALLQEGDVDRALIEFRNVFKLNGTHKEARIAYAQVEEERGNIQGSYSQYLRLVEQYPDNFEGRRALARMAANLNNWEEVERHVAVAEEQAPKDPVVQAVRANLDYRNAIRDTDPETAALAVQVAENLLDENPDLPSARRVVLDDLLRRQDWDDALSVIDEGLATDPDNQELYRLRIGVLQQLGRTDEIADQLKDMVERFPDLGLHTALVSHYLAQDRLDEAEAYLRERVEQDKPDAQVQLISFLAQRVGRDAAIEEIDRVLAASDDNPALLRSLRAGLIFESGDRDVGIAEMEDILSDAEPSEETDRIKVALARMLIVTNNSVGARARVEEVLEHDPSQVEALKLKAAWLIEDDKPGDALVELRQALDQAPRDAGVMSLMARAHERSGNRDLMGEMLALAVEASGNAPAESLTYAQFLIQDDKFLPAEDVLQDALRLQNTNPQLLSALGSLYVGMQDWPRAQHVIDTLSRLGTEQGQALADELTARRLAGQDRAEDLEQFLEGLAEGDSGLQAAASIIRLRLAQGDVEGASEYVNQFLEQDPENPTMRFLLAGILIVQGQQDQAGSILQDLTTEYPGNERVWLAMYRLERSQGEAEKASQTLADAQAAVPESANLKWIAAGEAEQRGDIETAIAIYEEMYATNSNSVVVANNLASLISSYRDDDESLERAYDIARRLRGAQVPALQDTYGWIAYRLGNHEEALEYLEAAAKGLPNDPTVQYHLAEVYVALNRPAEALDQYGKVITLSEGAVRSRLPFLDRVEAEIKRLSEEQ